MKRSLHLTPAPAVLYAAFAPVQETAPVAKVSGSGLSLTAGRTKE